MCISRAEGVEVCVGVKRPGVVAVVDEKKSERTECVRVRVL